MFLLVCVLWPAAVAATSPSDRTVVVLLFDGWAPAVLEGASTPALARIRKEGAWTHHMTPVFPTISLVNQTTISTGCWPEHHGIVSNVFVDPRRGVYDHSHDADWLTGCEHLHQAAERQGVRTAALGWVGRFSTARGDLATYTSKERDWSDFPSDAERTEQVVRLLRLPDAERPRLLLAYFEEPDDAEHFSGMTSEQTRRAVEASDAAVGRILAVIDALPFRDQATLIVTTDHGMVPVTYSVNLAMVLHNRRIHAQAKSAGTTAFLYFADRGEVKHAVKALSRYPEFDVVGKQAQPASWHLGTGPRVGDLIVSAHPPYFIEDLARWPWWTQWLGRWGPEFLWSRFVLRAAHGYPPDTPGVEGILYAWGAGIPAGKQVPSIRAVDIHPTVCRLLGIDPGTPVDGEVAAELLATP